MPEKDVAHAEAAARKTAGRRIYAIGDIHGRADLLDALMEQVRSDNENSQDGKPGLLIFLGDYVDRGLDSRGVIDRALALREESAFETRFLKGNHEQAMLDFLARPQEGPLWLALGGAETLYSYGVRVPPQGASPEELRRAAEALRVALPRPHLGFLKELELMVRCGDYLFVHAGIRPNKKLEEQGEADLLTIRDAFTNSQKKLPFTVVHGHTPEPNVHMDQRRIGVDTGAYATGRLSAVRLEGDKIRVLST